MRKKKRVIWVFAETMFREQWRYILVEVQKRFNAQIYFFVPSPEDKKFYSEKLKIPDLVIEQVADFYSASLAEAGRPNSAKICSSVSDFEKDHRISVMREMILADRHYGKNLIWGGSGYPASKLHAKACADDGIYACFLSINFWEKRVAKDVPDLVLGYATGGGIYAKPLSLICRKRKIDVRMLFPFRFGHTHFWCKNEYGEFEELSKSFNTNLQGTSDEIVSLCEKELTPNFLSTDPAHVREVLDSRKLRILVLRLLRVSLQQVYWNLRGYRKAKFGPGIIAKSLNVFRPYLLLRTLDKKSLKTVPEKEGFQFVFFPLQQQPESSTSTQAKFSTDQLSIVRELALSLPVGAKMLVKEHIWALNCRPFSFYDELLKIPNLILLHPTIPGLTVIKQSDLVCSINSSAIYEAAALGIKVVQVSENSSLKKLPYVHHLSIGVAFEKLRDILSRDNTKADVWNRKLLGAKFYFASQELGIDLKSFRTSRIGSPTFVESVKRIVDSLAHSLE